MQLPMQQNVLQTLSKIEKAGDLKEKKLLQTYFTTNEDQKKIHVRRHI